MKKELREGFAVIHLGDTILAKSTTEKKHKDKGCRGDCTCDGDTWFFPVYYTKEGAEKNKFKSDKVVKVKIIKS